MTFCRISVKLGTVLIAAVMFMSLTAGSSFAQPQSSFPQAIESKMGEKSAASSSAPTPDSYATEPIPLTPAQCGQCHSSIYSDLKNDGGRHKLQCNNCHTRFHAYNPNKQNWQQLMPKCSSCHVPTPHDSKLSDCSSCHGNPHAPKKIPMSTLLVNSCSVCHSQPFESLQKFPTAHSKLQCQSCHSSHGYVPSCNACHKSHYQGQTFATCAKDCHPVHMPLQIKYKKDVDSRTCGACHDTAYAKWSKSPSKHGKVSCASCHHTKHGNIPACTECHNLIHSKELHERFPKCLTCHQDPHDPPVKQRSK